MKKHSILLINLILFVSLLGIIIFQFSWINQIVRLNNETFKKEIQDVLSTVSTRLEEKEIYDLTKDNLQSKIKIKRSNEDGEIELIESSFVKKILDSINSNENISNNFLEFNFELGNKIKVEYTFVYIKRGDGDIKIILHHSSLPYNLNFK